MKQIDTKVKKRRTKEITDLFLSYQQNSCHLGTTQRVWFSEHESFKGQTVVVGHTKDYIKVIVPLSDLTSSLIGKCALMKITKCFKWHIEGEVLEMNPPA